MKEIMSGLLKSICSVLILLVVQSCTTDGVSKEELNSPLFQGLKSSIENTPYSARIQQTSIKPLKSDGKNDNDVDEYIVDANVLETYRGKNLERVRYSVFVEKGELMTISKEAMIVSLCIDKNNYYWPGVGSSFPADKPVDQSAKRISQALNSTQSTFSYCN